MDRTKESNKQLIKRILKNYNHKDHRMDLKLSKIYIKDFYVDRNVFNPDNDVTINLVGWLIKNKGLYENKIVIDMGCGSGILGIICGLNGAKKILFSDLSKFAIDNTKKNVKRFKMSKKSMIFKGNLFEKINENADIIIFNHPFFLDHIIEDILIKKQKFEKGKILHEFLEKAKKHLKEKGIIIMPYIHLAGIKNDPGVQSVKYGFSVKEEFRKVVPITNGRKGPMSIYNLN